MKTKITRCQSPLSWILGLGFLALFTQSSAWGALYNDSSITIKNAADIAARRGQIISYIWGQSGWPSTKMPSLVKKNIISPVSGLDNLQRVDELRAMVDAVETVAYHFIPQRSNKRLVILHQGHHCTLDDGAGFTEAGDGMQRTINNLLVDGYSVLAMYMPKVRPGDCGGVPAHEAFFTQHVNGDGKEFRFFMEPVAVSLNYLRTRAAADTFPTYSNFNMIGLSGGGWTTVLYSALDPTIQMSFQVAGSLPLYLRSEASTGSRGDIEQILQDLYQQVGYLDLYLMASYGSSHKQVQILNRFDTCCFGQNQYSSAISGKSFDDSVRDYETRVRNKLSEFGLGSFRVEIDEASDHHEISWNAIVGTILAELNGGRRVIGAADGNDAFIRGTNGHIWQRNLLSGWLDTGIAAVGAPAIVKGKFNQFDIFYRTPANRLTHAVSNGNGWQTKDLGMVVIADPNVATTATTWEVTAPDRQYLLRRISGNNAGFVTETVDAANRVIGPAFIVPTYSNQQEIFARGFERAVHRFNLRNGQWSHEKIDSIITNFPSATFGNNMLRVYTRGRSPSLFESSKSCNSVTSTCGGAWQMRNITATVGATNDNMYGSPTVSTRNGVTKVVGTTNTANLAAYSLVNGSWAYANLGGIITASPTSVATGVFYRGRSQSLGFSDGASAWNLGGRIE